MAIKIFECFSVSPPDGAAEQSLPYLYFDMIWLSLRLTEGLYFYSFKCSECSFLETTVVQLKHSLSLTLKHFLPLAGKIVFPLTSSAMPLCRYVAGDSVALTVALSDADFADMTGNHSKNADEFHALVPHMPPAVYSDDDVKFSPLAIQVTAVSESGDLIGFTLHHSICDATSLIRFIHAWALINKLNSDGHLTGKALPFYDRNQVQDATKLNTFIWAKAKTIQLQPTVSLANYSPLHKVRATFIVSDAQIERLKNLVMIKKPAMGWVSSFTVVCAHLWSCLAKTWEAAAEDEPVYLTSPVDCRLRLEPPLPENYFGNCVALMRAYTTHRRLSGEEGFVEAVEAIAAAIGKTIKHGRGLSDFFENGLKLYSEIMGKRVVRLTGSSRMDNYSADYGWGKTTKYECIHTDHDNGTIHLCKARDGGVEFGLSMPQAEMDAFAAIFNSL